MKLSAHQVRYLRTVERYNEPENRRWSWTSAGWRVTQASLKKRGLIEDKPHPRQAGDRQSVQLTDKGREVLALYANRETVTTENFGRGRKYVTRWEVGKL